MAYSSHVGKLSGRESSHAFASWFIQVNQEESRSEKNLESTYCDLGAGSWQSDKLSCRPRALSSRAGRSSTSSLLDSFPSRFAHTHGFSLHTLRGHVVSTPTSFTETVWACAVSP
ncbi:hypothetical protein CROQUDRAFT_97584 [Cronartium quercuum f. sp. fusiforme G11]|uniref:Uncharacterized protein n=1 Tax=Cronartium quercuum f. sp. fusiforme G11 TaxID=708437 RepID=A0A9P6T8C8_9BASI|nr:hypothetical protein CROQUDRAFT_97584 [Cronartium quercuum f. sp. fusiforme G11]